MNVSPIFAPRRDLAELHERTAPFAARLGVFAALVPPHEPTIAQLIDRAHTAALEASQALHDPCWRPDLPDAAQLAYEAKADVAEEEARAARQAMLDGLLRLGITEAAARRIGGLL